MPTTSLSCLATRAEGRPEGWLEGWVIGYLVGRQEGMLIVLRRVIQKRFGSIPDWAEQRLDRMCFAEMEQLLDRVLDLPDLDDLLR